jgi:hydrogenase maturation factor
MLRAGKLPPDLLAELLDAGGPAPPELRLGPAVGEDACAIEIPSGVLIAAADPITLTGSGVGAHAVVINANDVAVMGVRPRWFLATILLPEGSREGLVRELFEAMREALQQVGASLVGGHTEVTPAVRQPVIAGQMLGIAHDARFVRTGGARPGDVVVQVGAAPIEGAAVLGIEAAERLAGLDEMVLRRARAALAVPGISVVAPALAAAELGATALHDPTEGGLSAGLVELADASGVALCVAREAVLWFEPGVAVCRALGADPWGTLASGALLAAFPEGRAEAACAELRGSGFAVSAIGRAEPGAGVHFDDGTALPRFARDEVARVLS